MTTVFLPIAFVVFVWWISTGVVLWLARGLDRQIHLRLIVMTILCALGFAGVIISSANATVGSVYLAFMSAIAIWAWVEFTFLTGLITGSEAKPCPTNVNEVKRFWLAFKTICHHEYALLAMMCLLAGLDTTAGTGMAIKTFALLWILRLGAKLTIFSGVPRLSTNMMPERIAYMTTYFRHDRIGIGFWVSVTCCSLFLVASTYVLATGSLTPVSQTQILILSTLVGLALLEHVFMVLPFSESSLWQWAMLKEDKQNQETLTEKNQFSTGQN